MPCFMQFLYSPFYILNNTFPNQNASQAPNKICLIKGQSWDSKDQEEFNSLLLYLFK